MNKAVHFNEWASCTSAELRAVVEAYRELLLQLRCPQCESWLHVTPRKGKPEMLRCRCMAFSLNLVLK